MSESFELPVRGAYTILETLEVHGHATSAKLKNSSGRVVFGKSITQGNPQRVKNEVMFYRTVNNMKGLGIRCPELIEVYETGYISEWIEAGSLGRRATEPGQDIMPYAERIAHVLAEMQKLPRLTHLTKPYFNGTTGKDLTHEWWEDHSHVRNAIEAGIISEAEFVAVNELITRYQRLIQPGPLTHRDITLPHIKFFATHPAVILDAEHASYYRPPFEDLMWVYAKVAIGAGFQIAASILRHFRSLTGLRWSTIALGFIPMMARQCLGAAGNAYNARQGDDPRDEVPAVRQLLKWSLAEDMQPFYIAS